MRSTPTEITSSSASSVRTPPAAFTRTRSETAHRISRRSSIVAPPGAKPVEVFTYPIVLAGAEPPDVDHHVELGRAVGHRPFGLEDLRPGAVRAVREAHHGPDGHRGPPQGLRGEHNVRGTHAHRGDVVPGGELTPLSYLGEGELGAEQRVVDRLRQAFVRHVANGEGGIHNLIILDGSTTCLYISRRRVQRSRGSVTLQPPSTDSTWPVTNRASSESRKQAADATASGGSMPPASGCLAPR